MSQGRGHKGVDRRDSHGAYRGVRPASRDLPFFAAEYADNRAPMSGRPPVGASGTDHRRSVLIIIESRAAAADHRVAKQINALVEAGYFVRVITQGSPQNTVYRNHRRIRVFEYPPPPEPRGQLGYLVEYGYSVLAAALLLVRATARQRPDVVQFCEPPNIYFPLARICRRFGVRVVVDQRDLLPEIYEARYGSVPRPILTVLRFLERRSFTGADIVICVNDYLRERIFSASGLAGDRVAVVREGPVLAQVYRATPDPPLKRGHKYLCCWVGMMGFQDRIDLLLRSIDHLVHELGREDCEFAIIGAGEALPMARHQARELDLDKWVDFTGELDLDDVFRYLATADVGLDASLQVDVSPVKAMEYMAFGVPVVAFNLPETRNLTDGAAAYAEAGDVHGHARAIDTMLNDAERRRELGQVGQARVRDELAWDHQVVTYLEMIDRLCAIRRPRGNPRRNGDLLSSDSQPT
jgi:glycosyltransferase involved in cell wall biosynthesis